MIVVDRTIIEHVGIQKADKRYLFLHWTSPTLFPLGTTLVKADIDFKMIAPTSFVEWVE